MYHFNRSKTEVMPNVKEARLMHVQCAPFYFPECQVAYWIWRLFPGCLVFIGTLGNILNVIVLSRQKLRKNSTTVYLLFLAVSDLVFIWSNIFRETLYAITEINLVDLNNLFCKSFYFLAFSSGSFSIWLLVLLTIERLLMTRAPVYTYQKLTPRLAVVLCSILLFIIIVLNSHVIYGFTLFDKESLSAAFGITNQTEYVLKYFPCYHSSVDYANFYNTYWTTSVMVLYNVIPMCLIITGNVNIAASIIMRWKRSRKIAPTESSMKIYDLSKNSGNNDITVRQPISRRSDGERGSDPMVTESRYFAIGNTISNKNQRTMTNRSSRPNAATRLLFTLSAFFLVTTTPYCVYYVIKNQLNDVSDRNIARLQVIQAIVHTLLFCNYCFNFFFYFVSGTVFKQEWTRVSRTFKEKIRRAFSIQ